MKVIQVILISLCILLYSCSSNIKKVYLEKSNQEETQYAANMLVQTLQEFEYNLINTPGDGSLKIQISIDSDQLAPGAYTIQRDNSELIITGGDRGGLLYGVQEIAENLEDGIKIDEITNKAESPHLPFRAIKFNLPWDSYRRSDALQLHMETCQDTLFWKSFLDMAAENRFNVLTLWNLHPFDWMVKLEKYPEASLLDDTQFERWRIFWTTLFRMAKERGIDTYIVNWNIFVSDAFAEAHGVAEYSTGSTYYGVSDTSELVKDYTRECVREVINQYPDLTGIGFSLGEAMDNMTPAEREQWALDVIVKGMQQADRKAKLIHRVPFSANLGSGGSTDITVENMTREALESIDVPAPIWVEIKFNWSHAHSTPKLIKVHGGTISDVYWNPVPDNYRITWMMRNEDFFALRWTQTDFMRKHMEVNVHPYVGGYFIGSECYIPAKDYFTKLNKVSWEYAFERQWLYYKTWGRLLYDPSTPDDIFIQALDKKYGEGTNLFKAYNAAGKVPLMIATFWDLAWDFTLYTEGLYAFNGETGKAEFISIDRLIKHPTLDTAIINIDKFTDMLIKEAVISGDKITPLQFADDLDTYSKQATQHIETIDADNNTMRYELGDIKIWANLGLYFSEKVRAAIALSLYEKTKNENQKLKAIQHLENALSFWETIVEISNPLYKEMPLVHLNQLEDKYFHWAKLIDEVKKDIEIAKEK